jgi:hypothetical protein
MPRRALVRSAVCYALAALIPFASTSCAGSPSAATGVTMLTRTGEAVQVTDNAVRAQECEFISDLTPRSPDPSDVDAIRALRNDAGAAGSNLVLLVMETRTTIARAEGYLCADE